MGQVVVINAIDNFRGGQGIAISQDVQNVKMQSNILVCKAFCLECFMERIMRNSPAIHR